jgi:hypothetical protein
MPRIIDFDTVKGIIRLRFTGYSTKDTAEKMGCSTRTVRNKVNDFIQVAEKTGEKKEGLMIAAEEYGVKDLVQGVLKLSEKQRETGLGLRDSVKGMNVYARLVKAGMQDLEDFLVEAEKTAQGNNYPLDELFPLIVECMKIKNASGKGFKELVEEAETIPVKIDELAHEEAELRKSISKMEQEHNQKLEGAETTSKKLEKYLKDKETLSPFVSFEEIHKVANLVGNLNDLNYNTKEIIDFYSNEKELKEKRMESYAAMAKIEECLKKLEYKKEKLQKDVDWLQEEIMAGKELKQKQLEPIQVRDILDHIIRVSAENGLEPEEAYHKYLAIMKEAYNPILRLENHLNVLESKYNILMRKVELREVKLETLEKEIEAKQQQITILKELEENGLRVSDVENWNNIIRGTGLTSHELTRKIEEYGDLQKLIEEARKELTRIQKDATLHKAWASAHEKTKQRVLGEIKAFTEEALNEILDRYQKIVDDIDELTKAYFKVGTEVGNYDNLNILMDMITGKPVEITDALHVLHLTTTFLENWAETQREYELQKSFQDLIDLIKWRRSR